MNYKTLENCRVCDSSGIKKILSLGEQPLSNALKGSEAQKEDFYPLTLSFCENCGLSQIIETVDKEILFSTYYWVTGTSSTAREFAETFYQNIQNIHKIEKNELIIEIASNDGTFLRPFVSRGHNAIGVDPASNISEIANKNNLKTINAFWNKSVAEQIIDEYGKAKLIFARNVIPHVTDLHEIVEGINHCISDNGICAIEFHYAGNIFEGLQYDSIYHEHLCYFSIKSISKLFGIYDFKLFHIDLSPISGGAYIAYFSKQRRSETNECKQLKERENNLEIDAIKKWQKFADICLEHRETSKDILSSFKNKTVVGFGASARSSTYLNFCGFNDENIKAIIDNNPLKKNKYTPGSSIQIVSIDDGMALKPDLIILLAWNFKDELISICREKGYGGPFLVAFPNVPKIIL